jgi:hypothetical protein
VNPPFLSRKQTPEYRLEAGDIASQKEVHNSTIDEKSNVDKFLGGTNPKF